MPVEHITQYTPHLWYRLFRCDYGKPGLGECGKKPRYLCDQCGHAFCHEHFYTAAASREYGPTWCYDCKEWIEAKRLSLEMADKERDDA